ncbi:MAG: chorismate synthase [Armatimonadetes bacterium]|nr:chorismate synthase [Armatimonadota bacterium]
MRFLTAGESHGKALVGIIEGLPAGLHISVDEINRDLRARQGGYGRGARMQVIEEDTVEIVSGVMRGKTIGSPVSLLVKNKDWQLRNEDQLAGITVPRPGHADLGGAVKYGLQDIREVSERASARETAIRTAIGSVAKQLLGEFGMTLLGWVLEIGGIRCGPVPLDLQDLRNAVDQSPLRCADPSVEKPMMDAIDKAKAEGDTLGGVFAVLAHGVPCGLGSYVHWDRRLDGLLAQALLSIPSVKGMEFGEAFANSAKPGSSVHDEILYDGVFRRKTNRAGGVEGGVSTGEAILVKAAVKPLPTLKKPLNSVDIYTKVPVVAHYQRSDVCVVPAASVVGEAVVAWVLACAFCERFGRDELSRMKEGFQASLDRDPFTERLE